MSWPQSIPNYVAWKFKQEEPDWQYDHGSQKPRSGGIFSAWKELEKLSEKEREAIKNIKKSDEE